MEFGLNICTTNAAERLDPQTTAQINQSGFIL
jgi:hypothetical protein